MKLSKKFKLPHIFRISIELRQKSIIAFKKAYFKIETVSWYMLSSCIIETTLQFEAASWIEAASLIKASSHIETTSLI